MNAIDLMALACVPVIAFAVTWYCDRTTPAPDPSLLSSYIAQSNFGVTPRRASMRERINRARRAFRRARRQRQAARLEAMNPRPMDRI